MAAQGLPLPPLYREPPFLPFPSTGSCQLRPKIPHRLRFLLFVFHSPSSSSTGYVAPEWETHCPKTTKSETRRGRRRREEEDEEVSKEGNDHETAIRKEVKQRREVRDEECEKKKKKKRNERGTEGTHATVGNNRLRLCAH